MLATIDVPVTEANPPCADAAGDDPRRPAHFPHIVPADPPPRQMFESTFGTRKLAAMGLSFLGHVGVLAWLGFASEGLLYQAITVQQGHASIQLKASMASAPQQANAEEQDPVPIKIAEAPEPPPQPPEEPLTPAELDPRQSHQQKFEKHPVQRQAATMQVATVPESDLLALTQSMERAKSTHADTPHNTDSPPPLTRKDVEHPPIFEVRVKAVGQQSSQASMPSPATQASDGAESAPSIVHNPAPIYPRDAMMARQTGRVLLRVELAADGSVVAARVYRTSGVPSLDEAALRAVRQWRFTPAESRSPRNRVIGTYVNFEIDES